MFDWDQNNLRKISAHGIAREEAEQALRNNPIPIYDQDVETELRHVYYGETDVGRLVALIVTERGSKLRVVTASKAEMPKFKSESEEADWWASPAGRAYIKRKAKTMQSGGGRPAGSGLVSELNKKSTQIALRLSSLDIAEARRIAERKGIGYQTLLKMLVHEGLRRESRRS